MRWSYFVALVCAGLWSSVGCGAGGNNQPPAGGEPEVDAGQSPVEAPYPDGPYGITVGSVIKNYTFQGYRLPLADGEDAAQLETISLSDYYDPENVQYKLLHLTVGALWCTYCNQEADLLSRISAAERSRGVAVIQALSEADKGKPATVSTLNTWIKRHSIKDFSVVLDPMAAQLGQFFTSDAIPWNAYVDVRTMTVLYASVGFDGATGTEDGKWLAYVASHPAK